MEMFLKSAVSPKKINVFGILLSILCMNPEPNMRLCLPKFYSSFMLWIDGFCVFCFR